MGGAQPEHNTICVNLGSELRGSSYRAFPSNRRAQVNAGSPYLYPDVSAACEPRLIDRLDAELALEGLAVAVPLSEIYLDTGLAR